MRVKGRWSKVSHSLFQITTTFKYYRLVLMHCYIFASGFVTMAYMFFGSFLVRYATPFQTQQSLFNMLLGKFSFEELIQIDETLGAIFFMSYSNCMMLITMNIFVVILDASVGDVNEGKCEAIQNILDFFLQNTLMKGSPIAFIYYGCALEKIFISTSCGRFGKVQKYQIKKTSFLMANKIFLPKQV